MTIYVDREFAERIGSSLKGFEKKGDDKWAFRCPYCGDSKNKTKKRGGFYRKEEKINFRCFNCGHGTTLGKFLRDEENPASDPSLSHEYQLALFGESSRGKSEVKPEDETFGRTDDGTGDFFAEILAGTVEPKKAAEPPLTPLAEFMPAIKSREARRYLTESRHFPLDHKIWDDFLYSENFARWSNVHANKHLRDKGDDPRIVLPMITRHGVEFGAQGRSTDPNEKLRYVITTFDDRFTNCYGAHLADFDEEIWVTEGAMDSVWFDNGLAAMNGDLGGFANKYRLSRTSTVLVFDNEPGNKHVAAATMNAIKDDWKVAFWNARSSEVGKDVDEALERGHSLDDLFNVKEGLSAELEFARWKGNLR